MTLDHHEEPTLAEDSHADVEGTHTETHVADSHGNEHADTGLMGDTNTWVLLAFLIVVGLMLWQGVPKLIGGFLKSRADSVRNQLDEARSLREEAQRLLADFQKRQRDAEAEAEGIIDQAKRDAKIMGQEARTKIDEQLTRRRKSAEERIARAEAQAIAEIRGKTADLAIAAASQIIGERMDGKAQGQLIDRAISEVGTRLN